ncbi:MAG: pyridoxamine 5'-phosphate oxidase [Cyanobacteria bacterium P01_H01_bin.15]
MKQSVANLRQNYLKGNLNKDDLDSDPITQFGEWFQVALDADILEPNAMTLATVDEQGFPNARIVLLKAYDDRGFVFHTNYQSQKGTELAANPQAALVFWWGELERQIRVQGSVATISPEESDRYYLSRPLGSQLGAWASAQSSVIADDRQVLAQRYEQFRTQFETHPEQITRPPHWGGYRVKPNLIEFWQGRPSRLHDRWSYRLVEQQWIIERLSP